PRARRARSRRGPRPRPGRSPARAPGAKRGAPAARGTEGVGDRGAPPPPGKARSEIAALDLARHTSATRAIYGRLDPIAGGRDSVRVQMIVIDAGTGRVQLVFDAPWAIADREHLPRALAPRVRRYGLRTAPAVR